MELLKKYIGGEWVESSATLQPEFSTLMPVQLVQKFTCRLEVPEEREMGTGR